MVDFVWPKYMGNHPRNGCSWSAEEDQELMKGWFGGPKDVHRLAIKHGRTDLSIECRLAKMLGFEDHNDFRRSIHGEYESDPDVRIRKNEIDIANLKFGLDALTSEFRTFRTFRTFRDHVQRSR